MSRKAQMEILGLAIVVLLLILGMVFVIRFIALSDKGSIRKEVSESQTASNYIATYLDTTVPECRGLTIEELLIDCAEGTPGPRGGSINCGYSRLSSFPPDILPPDIHDVKSCEQAQLVAGTVFLRTFEAWKTKYYFSSFLQSGGTPSSAFITNGTQCKGQKRSKDYFLSTSSGTLHVKLDLCG